MVKRRNFLLWVVMAALTVTIAACSSAVVEEELMGSELIKNSDGYVDISAEQLNDLMKTKDFTLVNVHIPYAGDIPNTDQSIAYNDLDPHLDLLPADKDATVVLYCRSGNMSTQAARALGGLGYTNVMEVDGGMNAWQEAGYDLLIE